MFVLMTFLVVVATMKIVNPMQDSTRSGTWRWNGLERVGGATGLKLSFVCATEPDAGGRRPLCSELRRHDPRELEGYEATIPNRNAWRLP